MPESDDSIYVDSEPIDENEEGAEELLAALNLPENANRELGEPVRGCIERYHGLLWHAWVSDTRPGGLGVSKQTQFSRAMRFFSADCGDRVRTNMPLIGQLVCDRTMRIEKIGVYASFSDKKNYVDFMRCGRLTFLVGDKPMIMAPVGYFSDDEKHVNPSDIDMGKTVEPPEFEDDAGFCGFIELSRKIAIPPRQSLSGLFEFDDDNFVAAMKRIESGGEFASFAKIMVMIEGEMTRSIL